MIGRLSRWLVALTTLALLAACAVNTTYYTNDDGVEPRSRYYGDQQPAPKPQPKPQPPTPVTKTSPQSYEQAAADSTLDEIWVPPHSESYNDTCSEGETWVSSYYAHKFHGRMTSNGEIFDMYKMTCAHKSLPFGTLLRVTNPDNGKSVVVRVNDRGPFIPGRDIDLSWAAAKAIGLTAKGVMEVQVEILEP